MTGNGIETAPNATFRAAAPDDAPAMAELDRICFAAPWHLSDFTRELCSNALACYIVCSRGGDMRGYAGLWALYPEGHIMNVAVHPGFRRKGIGAALLSHLIEWTGGTRGLTAFTLEVRASNAAAIRLYERLGFRADGRRKAYYEDNMEDALIMWRGKACY